MSEGITLYSTLSHAKETLQPGPDGAVRIYFCGPTVYAPIHIGNARPYVVFMVLKRYLERRGIRVVLASNLTDVNDKIYAAADAAGIGSEALARQMSDAYVRDTDRLGLGRPDLEPRVTTSVPEIVDLIGRLVDGGLAYPAAGDVYFRVAAFPDYGALSGRRTDELESTDPGEGKEDPLDFALWKGRKEDEDTWWESPWGPGRPGWHIECSAMAGSALGDQIQIHGGGIDLVFPHHENEIAQSEGATGTQFAQIWMHNEMLELSGDKMSKSEGNISLLSEVLDRWPAEVVVTYFLSSHYRSRLPFSDERMADAHAVDARLRNAVRTLDRAVATAGPGYDTDLAGAVVEARWSFFAVLDDDFNTPEAFASLFELVKAVNQAVATGTAGADQLREVRREMVDLLDVFGLAGLADGGTAPAVPGEVLDLLEQRQEARAARAFDRADELRDAIAERGFDVMDTAEGPQVYPR